MSRNNSLRFDLRKKLLPETKNNTTKRSYKRSIDRFWEWGKEHKVKSLKDVSEDVIQAYERDLEDDPKRYSPATIHSYLAPICKAAEVNMDKISKPRRTAGAIRRGRQAEANRQGKREIQNSKYKDCIDLQKCVGIRRNELKHLNLDDWDGVYITVRRGKGGKRQRQWILPEDRKTVNRIFSKRRHPDNLFDSAEFDEMDGHSRRLFNPQEIPQMADLHHLRAVHAQRAYKYFQSRLDGPNGAAVAKRMRSALVKRFEDGNKRLRESDPESYKKRLNRFVHDMDDRPYLLRGENLIKAEFLGLPTTYNRLALMMVSVYELSHWRLDVTVVNYMIL